MMFSAQTTGLRELQVRFDAFPEKLRAALYAKTQALGDALEAKVKANLSGTILKVRTGRLRASVAKETQQSETSVTGTVYMSPDVPYASILEYGGKTAPHVILPVKAKALAFIVGGKQVFAKRVNHPGSKIPAFGYMQKAFDDYKPVILVEYERTAQEVSA